MTVDLGRRAGYWQRRQSRKFGVAVYAVAAALMASGFALLVLAGTRAIQGWVSIAASVLLIAVSLVVHKRGSDLADKASRHLKGRAGEEEVGAALESLQADGMWVIHDLELGGGGNLDHVALGHQGGFLVETKYRSYDGDRDLRMVKRRARELAHRIEHPWVTPVICLARRSYGPRNTEGVWVMGRNELVPWLRAQREKPIDTRKARQLLLAAPRAVTCVELGRADRGG